MASSFPVSLRIWKACFVSARFFKPGAVLRPQSIHCELSGTLPLKSGLSSSAAHIRKGHFPLVMFARPDE
jgi:hypothetical protein